MKQTKKAGLPSREEILADKFLALAFRPNRIKNRDLWDIVWLKQQGIDIVTISGGAERMAKLAPAK